MAANGNTPKINLRRTFGAVAILLVLGLFWLAFFGGSGPAPMGGQDSLGQSGSPLASAGAGSQPLAPALLASISTASVAQAGTLPGSGDNVTVLVLSGVAALVFSASVFFSTLGLRFGGLPRVRVHLRQITGA